MSESSELASNGPSSSMSQEQSHEEILLTEFKQRVADHLVPGKFLHRDHFLKKWLIARKWDVEKAVNMFLESERFKKEMNVEQILQWKRPQLLKEYYCGGVIGHDADGNPVKFAASNMDMKGIMYSVKKLDLIRVKLYECETVVKMWEEQEAKLGRYVDKMTVIFDQSHAKELLWGPARELNMYFVKMLESNYPEMLGKMFIINAPAVFPILWKFVMPFLAEETKNKIHILGSNFQASLLENVGPDTVPAFCGGTLVDEDGDPMCTKIIGPQGKIVPEKYYLKENYLEEHNNLDTLEVIAGSRNSVPVEITKAGTFIKWEFLTKSNDIAFGIEMTNDTDESKKIIVPITRVNSHIAPEDGATLCSEVGSYAVVFDNSFSWTKNKVVQYKIEVITQDEQESRSIKTDIEKMRTSDSAMNFDQATPL